MNPPLTFWTLNRITTPTHSPQAPQGSTFETLLFFSNNNCIPFVLSTLTLRPFPSTAFFHLSYLSMTSFNDFPHKTWSSHTATLLMNYPLHLLSEHPLPDFWWTPAFTEMNLIVPHQQFYNFIKRNNPIYEIFWDTLGHQNKTNNFPWYPIKSLFQVNEYK